MVICHIMCEFCIVAVKLIVLALGLATLGLNSPDSAVFLHDYIVSIEEPLILKSIPIYDREVLLTGVISLSINEIASYM